MNDVLIRIEMLRMKNNMKASKLCDAIGIRQNTYSTWKMRDSYPDVDSLMKISNIFGVSMDYLVFGKKEDVEPSEILVSYNMLNDTGKSMLLDYAEFLIGKYNEKDIHG